MATVLGCIVYRHNHWLVLLAALLCGAGSWVTARLFQRTVNTSGMQRLGWQVLTAISAGVAIWCTHFIAMLGFDAGAPVQFDLPLTLVSLLIAVGGSTIGFALTTCRIVRIAPALGGAIVGVAIVLMHYTGMLAWRVEGIVSWDIGYLVASVLLAMTLAALALHLALRPSPYAVNQMAGVLSLAILALHFTGMSALRITPLTLDGAWTDVNTLRPLALAVAGTSLVIVCTGLVSYVIDSNVRAESLEHLRRLALSDMLTGLPNRASFNERLDLEIALAQEQGTKLALIGIDLNRFKEINDLRGHHAGDEVLRILARRMSNVLREGEFVARIGGDEFAALCRMGDDTRLMDLLERLEPALFKPVRLDDYEVVPGASFGVAIYPDDAATKAILINNADLAMYRAKGSVAQSVCFYEPAMDLIVRARRSLAADLRRAVADNQLSIHYQVQTSLTTGEIRGYEALLRWQHATLGTIPPTEFIPLAEENGVILEIGAWVLREACARAATWEPPYTVAVNVSAVQFMHADLTALVADVLEATGLPASRLQLELTESTIFAGRERALDTLRQIKALGVSIALDDFGTGYSSLDTLRSFPFDRIKLDQSFVADAEAKPQDRAIIRAVLALGKSLGIPILAEGIETRDQLVLLADEGCDEAQGFLLGRPAPLNEIVGSGQIALTGSNRASATVPASGSAVTAELDPGPRR
ncbi:TPA: EAL domain-containing protein [Burkholderia cepacia ATCC 25416]|uniref:putative bifunctional diguanylate cyclase/phosphodiesterase n=1 Tax=Burkholderia cepacia TaxID=292 RepID=UPI001CF2CE79|nr:EAL domain-containing protein [Burkholderia cepacia]HDR9765753.1 EAL domain-containing protein [Burkholderia cepacia ATCC 25416]MCA8076844.1 EAL domain-containing protein [Burkholderia cepacia]HDR9773249.1 EAL domain-containing protein [Burkholderia cepacia ATCC 25416]HDR9781605.1 EAL domain-containing protein [Burkholderia cepacia ATCC 25416]HDR9789699.1 EAL domain-containing protein [Burkholderia cepacia ATCC 25416]